MARTLCFFTLSAQAPPGRSTPRPRKTGGTLCDGLGTMPGSYFLAHRNYTENHVQILVRFCLPQRIVLEPLDMCTPPGHSLLEGRAV